MQPDARFAELMERLRHRDADAAGLVFDQFARRLVGLAARRLPTGLAAKVDPEDVVQSVFRTFFGRYADGQFSLATWDSLWALLTALAVRKCGHRVRHFKAACRDVRREMGQADGDDSSPARCEIAAPQPTPEEAVLLADTLGELLLALSPAQRPIVQLRLQGETIEAISTRVGCTERTVHRVLEKVRGRLQQAIDADAASP